MLVKLSPKQRNPKLREEFGPLWVNTDKICKIEQRIDWRDVGKESGYERHVWYRVTFDGDTEQQIDQAQFDELMRAIDALEGVSQRPMRDFKIVGQEEFEDEDRNALV